MDIDTDRIDDAVLALMGSVRSRAKKRQIHKSWCLTDVEEPLHLTRIIHEGGGCGASP